MGKGGVQKAYYHAYDNIIWMVLWIIAPFLQTHFKKIGKPFESFERLRWQKCWWPRKLITMMNHNYKKQYTKFEELMMIHSQNLSNFVPPPVWKLHCPYCLNVHLKVNGLLPFIMEYVWNGIHYWGARIVAEKKCLYLAWRLQVESYLV